jgi:succinate dehydrogenase / fumarate reductase membrane anchor subunit
MVLFVIVLIIAGTSGIGSSYVRWKGFFMHPVVNIATALFFTALMLHAWVGIRDVVLDYIHSVAIRFILLFVIAMTLFAMVVWSFRILFSL